MKRLYLLRHAKAVPGDAKTKDAERTLNERGRADASRMGGAMHRNAYRPDRVLSSSSKRTAETWQRLAPELQDAPQPAFLDSLYLASSKAILEILRASDDRAAAILVIGHNPGLEECAVALSRVPAGTGERAHRTLLETKYPTCGLAAFDFDIARWSELAEGSGVLVDFIRPKDLRDA